MYWKPVHLHVPDQNIPREARSEEAILTEWVAKLFGHDTRGCIESAENPLYAVRESSASHPEFIL